MCDTILAPPGSTGERVMLLGKNSDRQRNEAQAIEFHPRAVHDPDASLRCTYITIPQAQRTSAVLLCKPFWMWGAEMGANEHGVTVANEALHARGGAPEKEALTGMDLLRLALERARTAALAVNVITDLLERWGQGGNCGHLSPSYYHNGFMIADAREAFVLETFGREWVVERVSGVRAISNAYTIGRNARRVSDRLVSLIHELGWSTEAQPNYAEAIANPNREHIGSAGARRARSTFLLQLRDGRMSAADMMRILRDHGVADEVDGNWRAQCSVNHTLCMHAGADDRPAQTVGSMVSELDGNDAVHWITGTAAPCISVFKPALMDVPLPLSGPLPTDRFDTQSLWWRHERLHRAAVLGDFARVLEHIRPERDQLEAEFQVRVRAVLNGGNAAERSQVINRCWQEACEAEMRWHARIRVTPAPHVDAFRSAWAKMNQLAGVASLR